MNFDSSSLDSPAVLSWQQNRHSTRNSNIRFKQHTTSKSKRNENPYLENINTYQYSSRNLRNDNRNDRNESFNSIKS